MTQESPLLVGHRTRPGRRARAFPGVRPFLAAMALAAVAGAAGCASEGRNAYEPPPDDGSANANSADVVTEPPVTPR